ncbi:hypothetical protein NECAME_15161 [Necator americanus]|uniref:Uncharacterized protein n=1 Tax=Necator americanus TaxID=51031 RepID=W2SJ41_NECAM|nr:hypothetical protein NECAME_15161 [Necator americanus]ETN69674.1 hypothetical protein NECAME_15161 [Necator americanus]
MLWHIHHFTRNICKMPLCIQSKYFIMELSGLQAPSARAQVHISSGDNGSDDDIDEFVHSYTKNTKKIHFTAEEKEYQIILAGIHSSTLMWELAHTCDGYYFFV